jgi:hypothetical protein
MCVCVCACVCVCVWWDTDPFTYTYTDNEAVIDSDSPSPTGWPPTSVSQMKKGSRCAQKKQKIVTKLFFLAGKRHKIHEMDQQMQLQL